MAVFLDTETTGLNPSLNEIVEIAIIDDDANILLNSLVKPVKLKEWKQAEAIHGISPQMVTNAPSLDKLRHQINSAVSGQQVVIYNVGFDAGFLGELLDNAQSLDCCMKAWSEHKGIWSDSHNNYRWHKLINAANEVSHQWTGDAHRALADTLACRSVWHYLNQ